MSKASIQGRADEVKNLFYTYSGAITLLFVFVSLIVFFFAEYFVHIMGGAQYLGTDPITGFNATVIVRVFCLYGLLLPIDRMTGIGLESVNRPDRNMVKVVFMVVANVVGDIVAVFVFKSLAAIAIASIIFTFVGVWVGYRFLDKELSLDYKKILSEGIGFYREAFLKLKAQNFINKKLS